MDSVDCEKLESNAHICKYVPKHTFHRLMLKVPSALDTIDGTFITLGIRLIETPDLLEWNLSVIVNQKHKPTSHHKSNSISLHGVL